MRFHEQLIGGGFLVITALFIGVGFLAWKTTKDVQGTSNAIMKENVTSLKAAEELELALLNQKGLVSSYFLDKNTDWLSNLEEKKKDFHFWMERAQEAALTQEEQVILEDIRVLYEQYDEERKKAISLFEKGDIPAAQNMLLQNMKKSIDNLYSRCEDLILVNERLIKSAETFSKNKTFRMSVYIWTTIILTLILGSVLGYFVSKRISAELVKSEKLASLGQLSATVAHEIRNPLTSIKMRLYSLRKEVEDKRGAREDLSTIESEVARLERIVQSFLDLSKLPQPQKTLCTINGILNDATDLLSKKASTQSVHIERNLSPDLPILEADHDQFKQAFINLMLNSLEAMPGGGRLVLTSFLESKNSKDKSYVGIKIEDRGSGIDPKIRQTLFEPFVTTKETGSGLGLYITRKIINSHMGELLIQNRPTKGAEALVRMPIGTKN